MKKSSIHWIMLVTLATGCNARLDPVHPDDWDLIQIDWLYEPEYPQTLNAQHPSTHRNQAPPPSNTSPSHWPEFWPMNVAELDTVHTNDPQNNALIPAHDTIEAQLNPPSSVGVDETAGGEPLSHYHVTQGSPAESVRQAAYLTREGANNLDTHQQYTHQDQVPTTETITHFARQRASIAPEPFRTRETQYTDESTVSSATNLENYDFSRSLSGRKRIPRFRIDANHRSIKHPRLLPEPLPQANFWETTSNKFNEPFQNPTITPRGKELQHTIDGTDIETPQDVRLALNVDAFRGNKHKRYSAFTKVIETLLRMENLPRLLLTQPEETKNFIAQFQLYWASVRSHQKPCELASLALTRLYRRPSILTWTRFYQHTLGMSEEELTGRIWKLHESHPEIPELYYKDFVMNHLIESLVAYLLFVDIITSIFPKPQGVDVTLDRRELFEDALTAFEGHTRSDKKFETEKMKKIYYIWSHVENWLRLREDYIKSGLFTHPGTHDIQRIFKAFFNLVFAHSRKQLTSQIATFSTFVS
ncbi:hypothetical protein Pst134EB_016698 [Puccinia striiformis f. sp. tritici]|nr:hypothetical protein Pst134EB_016698 [Puccinia striiformis f. sp. tritici]